MLIDPRFQGNISQTLGTYDAKSDPDCWWSATECTTAKAEGVPSDIVLVPEVCLFHVSCSIR
jgi:hypothetical protein